MLKCPGFSALDELWESPPKRKIIILAFGTPLRRVMRKITEYDSLLGEDSNALNPEFNRPCSHSRLEY